MTLPKIAPDDGDAEKQAYKIIGLCAEFVLTWQALGFEPPKQLVVSRGFGMKLFAAIKQSRGFDFTNQYKPVVTKEDGSVWRELIVWGLTITWMTSGPSVKQQGSAYWPTQWPTKRHEDELEGTVEAWWREFHERYKK